MATFRNLPLSTMFDQHADKSKLSLDWVLNSGVPASHSVASGILTLPSVDSAFSAHINVAVTSSLSFDIVLGRDWLQYCREAVPDTCFQLSSGILDLRRPPLGSLSKRGSDLLDPSSSSSFDASPVFPAAVMESPCVDDCVCIDQSACRCPSTSHNMLNNVPLNATNIIRNIFLGHHATRAAMNITVSGSRNLRFKLRAAIRSSLAMIHSADSGQRSSISVADFFNSFESHRKSVLIAIAVFHCIQLPSKPTVDYIRDEITAHIISGRCAQFSQSHSPNPLPPEVSLPDCADRLLTGLKIDYNHSELFRDLRKKLRDHIVQLRRDRGYGPTWTPPILSMPAPVTPKCTRREPDAAVEDTFNNLKLVSPTKKTHRN
ncbi:hypothetical protein DFH08DRAFT_995936, partial [Mycena albidolilacea]